MFSKTCLLFACPVGELSGLSASSFSLYLSSKFLGFLLKGIKMVLVCSGVGVLPPWSPAGSHHQLAITAQEMGPRLLTLYNAFHSAVAPPLG